MIDRRALLRLLAAGALFLTRRARGDTSTLSAPILNDDAIHGERFARRVFYTWTTPAQITELRGGAPLYSRSESPEHGPAHFDRVVESQARTGHPVAQLLRRPLYRRARFGWTNAWATLLGWPGEKYGDQLLRVVLRPNAWLAQHQARTKEWRFFDMAGRPVTQAAVLKSPERLAGVYFIQDLYDVMGTMGTFGGSGGTAYREVVLINEAMVESFEAGTAAAQQELKRSIAALQLLKRSLPESAGTPKAQWAYELAGRWLQARPPANALQAYELSLALPSPLYRPEQARIAEIISALERALAAQPAELRRP
jgi:hypothetical protein